MVASVTSLTGSGVGDFVVQRVTALILGLFTVCVVGWLLLHPDPSHADLVRYFGSAPMQVFATLALLSIVAHAWIGMWTVGTDYFMPLQMGASAARVRGVYFLVCVLTLLCYAIWGLEIIWRL